MNITSILDVSTFIWDESDFDSNKYQYLQMARSIHVLLEQIEKSKCNVLLRSELYDEILQWFPYRKVPHRIADLETITWTFFGNMGNRLIKFPSDTIDFSCQPEVVKAFFSDATKREVRYLISKIHIDKAKDQVFFTFRQIWVPNAKLRIASGNEAIECTTLESDCQATVEQFFEGFRPIFEHNEKHDRKKAKRGEYPAPLSCYDGNDNSIPQSVLDNAIKVGDRYYGWDPAIEVAVVFYNHIDNKYHGHNLEDENDLPNSARQYINRIKNGGRL
jgi:hypothetical protein